MSEYNRLENELIKIEKDINYIQYFIALIENYWEDDLRSCIEVIEKVMSIALKGEKYKEYIELGIVIAKYKIESCDYDGAVDILLDICEGNQNGYHRFRSHELLLNANNLLCKLYARTGNYDKGMALGVKNIVYTQEFLKPEIRINTIIELANIAIYSKDYKQVDIALEDISKMENMLTERNKIHRDLIGLRKSIETDDITWAIVYINRVWELVKENKQPYKLEFLHALSMRAMLNEKRNLEVQASKDYEQVDILTKDIGYIYLYGENKLRWSSYMKSRQKVDKAIEILESLDNSRTIPYSVLKRSYRQLSDIYMEECEWKLAYEFLQKISDMDEELCLNQPKLNGINELNSLSKISVKEKDFFDINKDFIKNDDKDNKNDIKNKQEVSSDNKYKEIENSNNKNIKYEDIPKSNILQNYEHMYSLLNRLAMLGKSMSKNMIFKGIDKELHSIFKEVFKMDFIILKLEKDDNSDCTVVHKGEEIEEHETIYREFKYLANYCMQERVNIKVGNGNFYDYHTSQIEDVEGIVVSSLMIIPIFAGEKAVGSIGLASYKSNYFDRNDLCTLKILASYIGMNIRSGELLRSIKHLEDYDRLTGLLGRTEFMRKGEDSFKYNQMHNKNTAIIMFFVDELKHINDRYGYEVGDQILREFGEILGNMTSGIGYAGRYSGETFVILLDHVTEKEGERFCKLVRKALDNQQFETKKGRTIQATMSGGLYRCDEYTMRFTDAIKYADSALYRARLLGNGYMMSYNV